jgi:hypothetical protein
MEETTIYDTDLQGRIDSSGTIYQYFGKEAVQNSIVLWLTSFKDDIIRNSGRGGYLTQYLYKPMSDQNRTNIIESIVDGFNNDYVPFAQLQSIKVTPDYENNQWIIDLVVYISVLKESIPVTSIINNLV